MNRNVILALLASVFFLMPATAQERGPRAEGTEIDIARRVAMMARQLELSEVQQAKLMEVYASHQAANTARMVALREALGEILTENQINAMREGGAQLRERMRRWRPGMERARRTGRSDRISRSDDRRSRPSFRVNRSYDRRDRRSFRVNRSNDRRDRPSDLPVRLSSEQREAMGAVRRAVDEARRAFAEENPDATDAEKRALGIAQRKELADAMESVLTAEQQLLMTRRISRARRPASLLGLSEDQEVKVKEALAAHRQAMEAWMETNHDPTPEARMESAQMQREALQSALKEILTTEQLQKLDRSGMRRDRTRRQRDR